MNQKRNQNGKRNSLLQKLESLDEKFTPVKESIDRFFCWLFRGCKD